MVAFNDGAAGSVFPSATGPSPLYRPAQQESAFATKPVIIVKMSLPYRMSLLTAIRDCAEEWSWIEEIEVNILIRAVDEGEEVGILDTRNAPEDKIQALCDGIRQLVSDGTLE